MQFRALTTDAAGNSSTSNSIEVVVDTAAPAAGTLSFSNLTDSGTPNTPPVTTDNAFDLSLAGQETAAGTTTVYQVSVNGGAFANTRVNQSGLANGDYVFRALTTDAAGNSSTSNSIEVVVDTAAPAAGTLSFANLTDSGTPNTPPVTTDNTFDLSLAGQETAAGTTTVYQVSVNGGAFANTTVNQSGLANGDYVFRALTTDAAGNSSTSNSIEVVVDTAAPAAGTLSFSNLTDSGTPNTPPVTTDNAFDLSLAGQETAAGTTTVYQVSVNGGAFANTGVNQSGLANGDYVFRALTTDAAGNSSTSNSIEVVVDTAAPAAGTLSFSNLTDSGTPNTPPVTTDNAFDLSLAGQETAAGTTTVYQVSVNGGAFANTGVNQSGLANGDYVFRALTTDAAGNSSTSNSIEVVVDTAAPAAGTLSFSNLTDSGTPNTPPVTTDNAFDLSLAGQETAAGTTTVYQVSVNGGAFANTGVNQSGLANGDYVFRALTTDAAGNSSTSNSIEVVVDTAAPAAGTLSFSNLTDSGTPNTPPVTTDNAFDLSLAGQETAAGTTTVYQVSVNGGAFANTGVNQSGLANGDYVFRALTTDAAGNSSTSNSIEVVVDTAAPAAGTLSFSNLTDSGTPNTPPVTTDNAFDLSLAGQETAAGTTTVYQVSVNGGAFANTGVNQSGLANGDYVFRALTTDAAGNSSTSNSIEVVVDTAAPAAVATVTGLSADTGTAGDFITSAASQTVSGSYTGLLGAGEKIQVSADGATWVDATAASGAWSASGVTLVAGTGTLLVRTIDGANTTAGIGHSYTLTSVLPVTLTIVTPNGYDMHGLYGDIANSDINVVTANDTQFDAINAGSGHTFRVIGTGLTYDGIGGVTGGTIAEIDIIDTATDSTLVRMTGFAIDAVAMNSAVNAFANSSDPSQLTAIFNQYSYDATGGFGNDNILSFANADSFDGGGGLNTVDYVHYASGITANLANPSQNTGNAAGDTYTNDITALIGTNFADTLIGNASTNVLEGGGGGDTLIGGGGALDFASYAHAQIGVTANLANTALNTNDALGDIYSGINGLIGSNFADVLTGDNNDNYLRGRGAGDTLDGGGGSDTADYFNGPAVRADLSNPATNTGDAAGDTYISIENLRGSNFNDTLVGNAGNNRLDGGLGIDRTFYAGATGPIFVNMAAGTVSGPGVGNDTLISIELVRGSVFDDVYVSTGYAGASSVGSLPPGFNEFDGGAGNDHITGNGNTALSYLTATNSVTVDIAAGTATGNASVGTDSFTGVNFIRGSAFGDTLSGSNNSAGIVEVFEGRGGNDIIDGRGGFDRAVYTFRADSIATGGITVNLAAGTVDRADLNVDTSLGSDTLRSIEAVRGTNFDDIYNAGGFTTSSVNGPNFGSAGFIVVGGIQEAFNEFEGLGGNDRITGNGNTRISFINANAGVTVDLDAPTAEPGSTGVAHGTALGDLAGVGNDTIFGGVNSIIGSSFADMFHGSLTPANIAEQYDGGAGNDTIDGGGGFDQAVYNGDLGTASGIAVTVGGSLSEKLIVSGDASIGIDTLTAVESVRGTNFADIYDATGFTGASPDLPNGTTFNEFEGMGGDDIITGNGNTRISYVSATAGVTVDLTLGTAVGNASVGADTFTGVSRARGSNFNDTIFGDGNANVLDGQSGNDLLGGRGGNDTLIGGANSDTFFYSAGADVVTDFDRSGGSFNHAEGDVINLVGSGVTNWAQLQSIMSQNGTDTLINFGGGNTMTLSNVALSNLTQSDFVFSAPISGDLGITVNTGGSVVLTTEDFHAIDPNAATSQLVFNVVPNPTNGHVAFAGPHTEIPITSFTEDDLEQGKVIFVHDGTNTTQATFKVTVFDGTTTSAAITVIATVPSVIIDVLTANGFDFQNNDPIAPMGSGQIQPTLTLTPPQITIINAAANLKFVFEGTNLALDNNLNPTDVVGGTITTIHVFTNDPTPVALFDLIGRVNAATWYDAVVADAAGNQSLFNALTSGWSISFFGAAGADSFGADDTNDYFHSSGGNDRFDGGFGFDRVNYTHADGAIDAFLAAGTVTKYADATRTTVAGVDILQSIEFITGTNFRDTFNASGFSSSSINAGSTVTLQYRWHAK